MNNSSDIGRRRFLTKAAIGTAVVGTAALGYGLKRGIRYPTLGLEPEALDTKLRSADGSALVTSEDFIQLASQPNETGSTEGEKSIFNLRAFSAQPDLLLQSNKKQRISLTVNNISSDAQLRASQAERVQNESVDGITRTLEIDIERDQELNLTWQLPYDTDFTFASIGDSGGHHELAWCIRRASELGAKFLLHLGDFNYQEGDYSRSVELFRNSPIPCYISIGNHDFHDSGIIYPQFLTQLGPLNHAFTIGRTRFVNLDTAASMMPYSAGNRGALINNLTQHNSGIAETVSYTHRPLHDPQVGSTHDIGSKGERDWLIQALKRIESTTLLSGHIHIYDRSEFMGIDNIIAGQGLGHQDILTNSDYSKMVIGEVGSDGKVSFKPEPLSMPMGLHCHPRSQPAKDSVLEHHDTPGNRALIEQIKAQCEALS